MSASGNKLLERLGLFVAPGFLDVQICTKLIDEMAGMPKAAAQVTVNGTTATDAGSRRALSVDVSSATAAAVDAAFAAVRSSNVISGCR
jgi:post-segregation antitoxin (ccd killing protein)